MAPSCSAAILLNHWQCGFLGRASSTCLVRVFLMLVWSQCSPSSHASISGDAKSLLDLVLAAFDMQ